MPQLDKTYSPSDIEPKIYALWQQATAFAAGAGARAESAPFSIVIPPPNVTGNLHMGHALNNTIQDILVRFERMRGRDVLWQPGTDHAGIATQMVVERALAEEGADDRRSMGREAFIDRIWAWKAQSGGAIVNQLKRLGASCDWQRERFTMDSGLSKAVTEAFTSLYNDGLIYKDKRLVNWDPHFLTAISDLEVVQQEVDGQLWYINYPIQGRAGRYITIATTRPETLLGDTAIAVHPEDERYQDLIGSRAELPLTERSVPIIADHYADPEAGTGAVKITPAHDFNDFEVGKRHDLDFINIFDAQMRLNDAVPDAYRGMDRYAARERIIADLVALGLLERVEPHVHMVPFGDRSHVAIEPWLTDQWYVDAKSLARPAIEAVEQGKTRFVPDNWQHTYFEWMRNIQPWCISRQLWWGHQIPAWYGPDGTYFVARDAEAAAEQALAHYGGTVALHRDEDVLDTWFSSALWPFSTQGWPEQTADLQRYFPTNVLVTGFDIIFFWVARMMMMSLYAMKEVPFSTVYIHALVRDDKGQKMSKSKGNVIDPLTLMDDYGADALRFTLAAMAAQGRDIKLDISRVAGYRNFATKLWNAARFCEMNGCHYDAEFDPRLARGEINRWIIGEVEQCAEAVTVGIGEHNYNVAASALYRFVWNIFCDWYLELIKPVLTEQDHALAAETRACAMWVLDQCLRLLHPFMPFITEELWQRMVGGELAGDAVLALTDWPDLQGLTDAEADNNLSKLIDVIGQIRSVRAELNVSPAAMVPLTLVDNDNGLRLLLDRYDHSFRRLARVGVISHASTAPEKAFQIMIGASILALPLADIVDLEAEQKRLLREKDKIEKDINQLNNKLANQQFVARAPAEVVEVQRQKRAEAEERRAQVDAALTRIQNVT